MGEGWPRTGGQDREVSAHINSLVAMLHKDLSIMLLVSRAFRQLPVQLAHSNLVVGHTKPSLIPKILWEESSWNHLQARDRLLAQEFCYVISPCVASHLAFAEVDAPTLNFVLTHCAVPAVILEYLIHDERHPYIVQFFVDNLTRLEKQP